MPSIAAVHHHDSRITHQLVCELPEADVDRVHLARAALQQAIGEATCRCAHVCANGAFDHARERVERALQLVSTARDVALGFAYGDLALDVELGARLVDAPVAHVDLAREHQRLGARSGRRELSFYEQQVDATLGHGGTLRAAVAGSNSENRGQMTRRVTVGLHSRNNPIQDAPVRGRAVTGSTSTPPVPQFADLEAEEPMMSVNLGILIGFAGLTAAGMAFTQSAAAQTAAATTTTSTTTTSTPVASPAPAGASPAPAQTGMTLPG